MRDITYRLDDSAYANIRALMDHYKASDSAQVISKSLALLKIAAYVQKTHGQLIIRKNGHDTALIVD